MYLFDKTLFRQMNKNCYYLQHKQPPFSASQGAYTCIASRHKGPYTLINIIKKTPSLASFFVFFFLTLSLSFFFFFSFQRSDINFSRWRSKWNARRVCVGGESIWTRRYCLRSDAHFSVFSFKSKSPFFTKYISTPSHLDKKGKSVEDS